jgi:hypothetical protein
VVFPALADIMRTAESLLEYDVSSHNYLRMSETFPIYWASAHPMDAGWLHEARGLPRSPRTIQHGSYRP